MNSLNSGIKALEDAVAKAPAIKDYVKQSRSCRDDVIPAMGAVRAASDELEQIVDADLWPLPTYAEMLFLK